MALTVGFTGFPYHHGTGPTRLNRSGSGYKHMGDGSGTDYLLDGGNPTSSLAQHDIYDHHVRSVSSGGSHRLNLARRVCAHVVPHSPEHFRKHHAD
jgi:hypothetical protein